MTRVTYDASVFLNGLLNPHGKLPKLFELPDDVQLVVSDVVAEEIFKVVLQSARLREALPSLDAISIEEISSFINEDNMPPLDESLGLEIDICADPNDNKYLVSALTLDCDYLVTTIPDLLALEGNKNWEELRSSSNFRCRILDLETFASML
ncbi:MAG: putative toxin-antitoxin system toxin component, PIN family [Candidatus Wallbacteria bacterium]|nr:putative toxin-antitoxin system toxin component, PIN family [Candidatus Wallbacteria bacterium]